MLNKGILFALLATLTFSVLNVLVKFLSSTIPPDEIAFFRGLIGSAVILGLMKLRGISFSREDLGLLVTRGILGGAGMLSYFYALSKMKLADVAILLQLSAFFVMVLSAVFLKEKLARRAWVYVAMILSGTMLILNPFQFSSYSLYALLGVLTAFLVACTSISIRKLAKSGRHHEYEIIFYFLVSSMAVGGALCYRDFVMPDLRDGGLLLVMGIVSLWAQIFLTGALKNTNAVLVEVVRYAGIVFNALWGFLLFGESVTLFSAAGAVLIVWASVALAFQKER